MRAFIMCAIENPSSSKQHPAAPVEYHLIPETRWKMDPLFSCCCNLFIKDILSLPPYPGGSQENVFIYKNHPIRWVSVMGIIVKAEERAKFFHYGVDDGTGVISCTCWKPREDAMSENTTGRPTQSLCERMEECHMDQLTCMEVGSLLNVRGKLQLYNNIKQISAFSYGRVSDPTHCLEVRAMSEQVRRYQLVYDIPFTDVGTTTDVEEGCCKFLKQIAEEVSDQIMVVSRRNGFQDFYLHELETVTDIYRVCCQPCKEFTASEENHQPQSKQISSVLKEAVKNLLDRGYIFKSREGRGLLHLTLANRTLYRDTLKILLTECQREEHENGCNFLHLYSMLRKRSDYLFITHTALRKLLNSMEEQGAIVSCDHQSYIPVR